MTDGPSTFKPESQRERWLKYGGNVLLASVVVIVLAVLVTYLAGRAHRRVDMTRGGVYSLKPQTKAILRDLKSPVRLTAVYSADTGSAGVTKEQQAQYAQTVADLLDEYKSASPQITTETVDTVAAPSKEEGLVQEVVSRYGGAVGKFKDAIGQYNGVLDQIKTMTAAEVAQVQALPPTNNPTLADTVDLAIQTVRGFPDALERYRKPIDKELKKKLPDYKAATDSIQTFMDGLSQNLGDLVTRFTTSKDDPQVPAPIRAYMTDSLPRYTSLKKTVDDYDAKLKTLGDLKQIDELREGLREGNVILVEGQDDLKVLSFDQVWKTPDTARDLRGSSDNVMPPRQFAGEQQVTSAVLSVSNGIRPAVVFVRPGGGPLTGSGVLGFRRGPFATVADRLRALNFDVLEKDLSGQYAMQAQMQGQPAPPEASDDQMKSAVWIALDTPPQQQQQEMGPPPDLLGPKLAEHLKGGGSALVLAAEGSSGLTDALSPWGITLSPEKLIVHQAADANAPKSNDMFEEAKKIPFIFVLNQYGKSIVTDPLQSLDAVLLPLVPVTVAEKPGYTATPILPVPQTPPAWITANGEQVLQNNTPPTFDPKTDQGPPCHGGAIAEQTDGPKNRLAVIGCIEFAINSTDPRSPGVVDLPDYDYYQRTDRVIARFPGNAELFTNSVLWLAKLDPMIAISPAAMQVSRIGAMSLATQNFWKIGVMLVGLPGLVVLAGVMTYFARRD